MNEEKITWSVENWKSGCWRKKTIRDGLRF